MNIDRVYRDLRKLLGDEKVSRDEFLLELHNRDAAYLKGDSEIIVFPYELEDIRRIVKYCYRYGVKIYPQGGSSELTGSSIPRKDGIILSFIRMNRVLESRPWDGYVIVEPGLRLIELNMELEKDGYFFPIDPASIKSATVGGIINTGAGGLRGFKYGTTKDWVLGLEVVLPDESATVLNLGSKTLKAREGYDLTRLIVGSEGTLALVTKAILKVTRIPGNIVSIAGFFSDLRDLMEAVVRLRRENLDIILLEFVDSDTVELVKQHKDISLDASGNMLIVGIVSHCNPDREIGIVEDILKTFNADNVISAYSFREAEEMGFYRIRRGFYTTLIEAAHRLGGGDPILYIEDISVPPSYLPQVIDEIIRVVKDNGVYAGIAGHVGDGNLHPTLYVKNREDIPRLFKAADEIMDIALKYGGVISSEHGIGLYKRDALYRAYKYRNSLKALDIMKRIKEVFDPKNILNPGKVLP